MNSSLPKYSMLQVRFKYSTNFNSHHTSYRFKYMQFKIAQCIFWRKMYAIQGPSIVVMKNKKDLGKHDPDLNSKVLQCSGFACKGQICYWMIWSFSE